MKLVRADYTKDGNTTIQGTGVILEVIAPDAPATKTVEITAANLLGYSGTNVAYAADVKPVTIDGLAIASSGCGCYGDGIQMRTNATTGTSMIYNTAEADLNKLDFTWAATKDVSDKNYHIYVEFSNKADFSELVGEKQSVKFDATSKLAEAVPTAAAKFFRISHANQGAVYMDKVEVVINEGSTPAPAAPVKAWNADDVKAGHSNANIAAVKDETGDVQFTVYKLGNANETVTFKYTPTEAGKLNFNLEFTTKYSNAASAYFWKKSATSTDDKMQVSVNGQTLAAPSENPNFQTIAGDALVKSEAADSGELANPVFYKLCEVDAVANEELTIVIKYLGGGNSFYIAGATLTK